MLARLFLRLCAFSLCVFLGVFSNATALWSTQTGLIATGRQARFNAVGMGLAVLVQVALGLERKATGDTRVGSFSCMGANVFLKNAWLGTWTATVSAHIFPWFWGFLLPFSG